MRSRAQTLAILGMLVFGTTNWTAHASETLEIKPESGTIEFVGSKNDGAHSGGFKKFSGTVKLNSDDLKTIQVIAEIDTGSLFSDHPGLTAHLLNEDFFDVDKFPKAVFRSTKVRETTPEERRSPGGEKVSHVLSGKLTFLGVTKELELPATIQLDDEALTIKGSYVLDRSQFGMTYGLDKIHKEVGVDFSLKLQRK